LPIRPPDISRTFEYEPDDKAAEEIAGFFGRTIIACTCPYVRARLYRKWACKSGKDSVFKAINKFFLAMTGAGLKAGE